MAQRQRLIRWKFLAGLLVAVLLPALVRVSIGAGGGPSLSNSLAGTAAAMVLGYYFFRSFANFPGVRGGSYILPSFIASYGIVLTAFFFLRIEYSRAQFISSFVVAIGWYALDYVFIRRKRRPVIGIVPVGQAIDLTGIEGVEWKRLTIEGGECFGCESIVADLRAPMPTGWERYLADYAVAGVPVLHYKQLQESLTGTVQIEHLSENNFGSLMPERIYIRIKLLTDMASALVLGVLLSPFLLLVALLIRIDSPGPALFRQARIGFRGRIFTVYKFRTMRHERRSQQRHDAITRPNDDRITRLGAVLRRYRIDELPQIWNVMLGRMSWIGPRPEAAVLSQWYEAELPFYRYRHIVRPGITGWAQVNLGHVADVSEVLWKLHYDFYYIKYFSPWLDLLITLRTIRTMLTGYGSR